jgi:hypothetical protein
MDETGLKWLAGVALTAVGLLISYIALQRNKRKDDVADGKQDGAVLTELGYIKRGIDRVEQKQDDQAKEYVKLCVQVERVDASVRSAHKRIDAFEGKKSRDEE